MTGRQWRRAVALAASVSMTAAVSTATTGSLVVGASPTACQVTNLRTHRVSGALQIAIDQARTGDHLTVRGTCHGALKVNKSLTIGGTRTRTSGRPTLDGDVASGIYPTVDVWCTFWTRICLPESVPIIVTLQSLLIREMDTGVTNHGSVRLQDVTIRAPSFGVSNVGPMRIGGSSRITGAEGGIYNYTDGRLTLAGQATVTGCTADEDAAGVINEGTMLMRDSSRIAGNAGTGGAGGLSNHAVGTLTMTGSSRISGNHGGIAGGVLNQGRLVMQGSSVVTRNVATSGAGGIYDMGILVGVRWPPTANPNVYDNTPDDVTDP